MPVYALGDMVPAIADNVFIAPSADVIGDVTIGAGTSIWFNVTLRGDGNFIRIGTGSNIQDNSVVHITSKAFGTIIGNDVLVGHSALIHGCTLEDNAFVGFAAQVMDGCVVASDAMLAAGALLTPGKAIPARELWAGRPARFVRTLSEEEIARNRAGVQAYQGLREVFRTGLRRLD